MSTAVLFVPGRAGGAPRLLSSSETCIASTYDEGFRQPLADGRKHHPDEALAAHKTLPIGSCVRVTRLDRGVSIDLPILDRGPFRSGRCIDLSRGAARRLSFTGLVRVRVEAIPCP